MAQFQCLGCGGSEFSAVRYDNHQGRLGAKQLAKEVLGHVQRAAPSLLARYRERTLFFGRRCLVCDACGLGRIDASDITEAALKAYYGRAYWSSFHGIESGEAHNDTATGDRVVGQLAFTGPLLPAGPIRSLEIGAADAALSRELKARRGARIDVIEASAQWADEYRRIGATPVADFFPAPLPADYDYIHGSHWLEHVVPEIDTVTSALADALAPGGTLFIEVPNCEAPYWRLGLGDRPHIHFFTPTSLPKVMARAGLRLLDLQTFGATMAEYAATVERGRPGEYPADLAEEIAGSVRGEAARPGGGVIRAAFRRDA